jgi:hypothetical protein
MGAIGVIVSLVYLAIQVRQSTTDTRHTPVDRLVDMWSTHIGAEVDNPHVADIWIKGLDDPESLKREEQAVLFAFVARILRVSKAIYIHHRGETVGADLWAGIAAALTDMWVRGSCAAIGESEGIGSVPIFRRTFRVGSTAVAKSTYTPWATFPEARY